MKRALFIIVLGMLCGMGAETFWFDLRKPVGADQADADLLWMRSELKLSNSQYERIKAIHDHSSPKLVALAAQVAQMRSEFDAFERERRTEGRVDFLEFARFVELRRKIDAECLQSTRNLVQATAQVMTPQQRELYFGIVGNTLGDWTTRAN